MPTLLKILILVAFVGGAGYGTVRYLQAQEAREISAASKPGAPARPASSRSSTVPVEVFKVSRTEIAQEIPATGSLVADESVEISSEQSRRLVAILAEEGTRVESGQALYQLDDADLQAQLREVEARRELAVLTKDRLAGLLETQAVPRAQVDEALSSVAVLDAQIDFLKTQIAKTTIRAPFDGRLGIRRASLGAWLTPDFVITSLLRTETIKVDFKLPERFSPVVREGTRFLFRAQGSAEWIEGTVTVVDPVIEGSTRSVVVRGEAPNPGSLMPGGFVNVRYPVDALASGFMVPSEVVVPTPNGSAVWVVEGGKSRLRPVEIGLRTAEEVQVAAGLSEGDQVVRTNLLRVREGAELDIRGAE
ncbi:MAG: efflux RND transporter periplasmic adaptor subunit [Candidatus Sumerlaeia bacterium]|nr:efflux RND transporter periplasmic adaptor subunit [Candidatus Sumerlaeia bacterium]